MDNTGICESDRALGKPARGFCIECVIVVGLSGLATANEGQQRQGNVYGINLGWSPSWSTIGTARLCGLARNLVGEWGYLRHGVSDYHDIEKVKRSVAMIRAHKLIYIGGGVSPHKQFVEEGKHYPRLDPDGSMRRAARAKAAEFRSLYKAGIPFYAVEVLNEVNVGGAWPEEKYAQWLYDFAVEVKKAYPGIKVCSCGMAGSGRGYYDKMLTFLPELKEVVDFWGLHPYGANNPPDHGPHGASLRSYEETIKALEKHGVDPIRLMCTETGYELEIGDVGKNPAYPPIKEDNRDDYMAKAFTKYYEPDQRIEVVAPFQLWDMPWHNWNSWDFMYHDGRPRPIYEAMAALPKSVGKDWVPNGPYKVTGRVTWTDTDVGIPRVIVYTEPGFFAAVTDDEGNYTIIGLEKGRYTVRAFSDGYVDPEPKRATFTSSRRVGVDFAMERTSLVPGEFDKPETYPPGWTMMTPEGQRSNGTLTDAVRTPDGKPTMRIDANAGKSFAMFKYGGYNSSYPNEVYLADMAYRCARARVKPGGGPWLELSISNGRGELLSTAKVYPSRVITDGKWHRITAALHAPANGSRIRLAFGVDNASGTFFLSEPFVGEADFPLPDDARYRTTGYVPPLYELNKSFFAQAVVDIEKRNPKLKTATITGQASDFRNRPIPRATIATDEPVFVTVADDDGRYKLTVPADRQLRVRVFAPGSVPATSKPVRVAAGKSTDLTMTTQAPPAPAELVNGGFDTFQAKEPGLLTAWSAFGTTDGADAHPNIFVETEPYEGEGMFFAGSGSNVKNGGAYQVIEATPGQKYRVSGMVQTKTTGEAQRPLDNNCRVGIDPTGGRDPDSSDIVWSEHTQSEHKWSPVSTEAVAQQHRITVFIHHEMRRANIWNLTLFDDIKLEKVAK